MELYFYNKDYQPIGIVDSYISNLWTEKFRGAGEWEFKTKMSSDLWSIIEETRWVGMPDSTNLMDIRTKRIRSHIDAGDILTLTGRSLEQILFQRSLITSTDFTGTLSDAVNRLILENFVSSPDASRRVPNMVVPSKWSSKIAYSYPVDTVRRKLPVIDVLDDFCAAARVGYKISFDWSSKQFVFDLYDGVDYTKPTSPGYVEFSKSFDNLSNSELVQSDENRFTRGIVLGRLGTSNVVQVVDSGATGLDMREVWIEGSTVESKDSKDVDLPLAKYKAALNAHGKREYAKRYTTKNFSCEVDPYQGFIYKEDYQLGDLVMVKDKYGYSEVSRIVSVTNSAEVSKATIVPVFEPDEEHTITEQQ